MRLRVLLFSFIFICFFAKSIQDDVVCDPVVLSYNLCSSNPLCKSRLFIDENGDDLDTFRFLFYRLIRDAEFEAMIDTWLCTHVSNVTSWLILSQQTEIDYDSLDDFYKLWIRFMSEYRECEHTNQYFDGVIKSCICKQDKECVYIHPHDIEFHTSHYQWLCWAIIVIIFAILIYFVKKTRELMTLFYDIKSYLEMRSLNE
jgi:hypothetical protein